MGTQPAKHRVLRFRVRWLVTVTAVCLAVALSFVAGHLVSPDNDFLSPGAVLAVGVFGAVLIICQLWAQLFVLERAAASDRLSEGLAVDVRHLEERLRITNTLAATLNSECRSRRIACKALDFMIEEMHGLEVTFWEVDASGQPTTPILSRSANGVSHEGIVAQAERGILAGSAARERRPVLVDGRGGDPRHLGDALPAGQFQLFVPCAAGQACVGLVEVQANARDWQSWHWDSLDDISVMTGAALARGTEFDETQEQADVDFVTGLYNARYVQVYLSRLLQSSPAKDKHVAVIFLDVDNFKAYNDSLGHGAGDRVLQIVAQQLKLMTDRVGVVGRSGGDEFIIVLPDHHADDAQAFIEAFHDWLAQQSPLINGVFRISVSCGYAVFPDDAGSRHELLGAADARLYRAKNSVVRPEARPATDDRQPVIGVYGLLDRIVETLDGKDDYTRAHCERTAEYALRFAQSIRLSPSAQRTLRLAALLHDVGKIGVPDHILRKPGPLSEDEFDIMKHQVHVATNLIVDIPNADEVRRLVKHHHERWDGSGYPDGLKGDEIPYLARILSVAEAFAAVTMNRPYREALAIEDACRELRSAAGSQLDPVLVTRFIEMVVHSNEAVERGTRAVTAAQRAS